MKGTPDEPRPECAGCGGVIVLPGQIWHTPFGILCDACAEGLYDDAEA